MGRDAVAKLQTGAALPDLVGAAGEFAAVLGRCEATAAGGDALEHGSALADGCRLLLECHARRGTVYVIGNGGSAAVASHIVNDFCNTARLRATTLHEPALMTCYANDYGYHDAYAMMVRRVATPADLLVAISSSGCSDNINRAAQAMVEAGGTCITLSGFRGDNPLRRRGQLNFWLDSRDYGTVEIGHLFLLHLMAYRIGQEDSR